MGERLYLLSWLNVCWPNVPKLRSTEYNEGGVCAASAKSPTRG
jgi:hypothetical protein